MSGTAHASNGRQHTQRQVEGTRLMHGAHIPQVIGHVIGFGAGTTVLPTGGLKAREATTGAINVFASARLFCTNACDGGAPEGGALCITLSRSRRR
eukprot:scaffold12765_cov101-Isochrysis_galbana.AAC.2